MEEEYGWLEVVTWNGEVAGGMLGEHLEEVEVATGGRSDGANRGGAGNHQDAPPVH